MASIGSDRECPFRLQTVAVCQYLPPSVCIITEQEVRQQAATSAVVTIHVSQLPSFAVALGS
jgi:hypothetical protein